MTAMLLLLLPAAGLEDELVKFASGLERPSITAEAARARAGLKAANEASTRRWEAIKTSADLRKSLRTTLGELAISLSPPTASSPPRLETRGVLKQEGHKVALVTFPSPSGCTVTANLYSPLRLPPKMPGLILVHSHHSPKTQGELQDMGAMWARAGCHVLVMDLLGHGERRQHPFASAKDFPAPFRVSRQDYWCRHVVGMQLQTAGQSLMGWMVADISAAVSILLSLPGIDKEKIAVLGSVAGGGDPAAVAAALDERIKAAAVFNFGGPQPETRYPLPADAATSFNYAGGGSWETTRNLADSASTGALPWVIVGSIAPRRLIYCHEFSWDEKRDPVWARLKEIWKKAPGDLRAAHGQGTIQGTGADAGSHCNNIGPTHRKGIHAAFKAWWGIDAREPTTKDRLPGTKLQCLNPKERLAPARELARKAIKPVADVRAFWKERLGVGPVKAPEVTWAVKGPVSTGSLPQGRITLLRPEARGKRPLNVLFGQGGGRVLLVKRAGLIAKLVSNGDAVAVVDLGGTADLPPGNRGRNSSSTSVASSFLMLGKPLLGERLRTLRQALAVLRKRKDIDAGKIRLWGESTEPANDGKKPLVVPLGLYQPAHSEPVGPHLALIAALFEEVAQVRARGGLVSWMSLLESSAVHFPYDGVVPGAARADWPAVAAKLPRTTIVLQEMVDGLNRRVPLDEARKRYAGLKNVVVEK